MNRCAICAEAAPCHRCTAPEASRWYLTDREPSRVTIALVIIGAALVIYATWFGGLFDVG